MQYLGILTFCSIGVGTCYVLQYSYGFSSYLASALVGLVGSFLPQHQNYDHKKLIASLYAGSFASMCTLSYFTSAYQVIFLGIITGLIFIIFGEKFRGHGGKLGTIGFLSCLLFIVIKTKVLP